MESFNRLRSRSVSLTNTFYLDLYKEHVFVPVKDFCMLCKHLFVASVLLEEAESFERESRSAEIEIDMTVLQDHSPTKWAVFYNRSCCAQLI
jgi:hypothetical protein